MRTFVITTILIVLGTGTCFSQSYQVEYEYTGGEFVSSAFALDTTMNPDYFDLNNDGTMDIVIRHPLGWPEERLVFVDGSTYEELWTYTDTEAPEISFKGLMDLDGDVDPELLVSSGGTIKIIDYPSGTTVATIPVDYGSVAAYDFDSDGLLELLVNSSASVQVWRWDPNAVSVPEVVPPASELSQNQPNPFNPRTTIKYQVQSTGEVRLNVLDMRGRLIRTLVSEFKQAGDHEVVWDGIDDRGKRQASGSYLYVLHVGEFTASRKLLLLK